MNDKGNVHTPTMNLNNAAHAATSDGMAISVFATASGGGGTTRQVAQPANSRQCALVPHVSCSEPQEFDA